MYHSVVHVAAETHWDTLVSFLRVKQNLRLKAAVVLFLLQRGVVASGEHEGKVVVKVSERFFRPAEVELLLGDPTKAKEVLGWHPEQLTSVEQLCEEMVDSDVELGKLEIMNNEMKKKLKVMGWEQQLRLG